MLFIGPARSEMFPDSFWLVIAGPLIWLIWFFVGRWRSIRLRSQLGLSGPPATLLLGNLGPLVAARPTKTMFRVWDGWSRGFGPTFGLFIGPRLIVSTTDPDVIRDVFVKRFAAFTDRVHMPHSFRGPLRRSLLNLKGDEWRSVRATLAPTFSNFKMKQMFGIIGEEVGALTEKLAERAGRREVFDLYDDLQALTLAVIGRCAFGVRSDVQRNARDPFYVNCRRLIDEVEPSKDAVARWALVAPELGPLLSALRWLGGKEEADEGLLKGLREAVQRRERELAAGRRPSPPDALQLMMEAGGLTSEDLLATGVSFLLAGYETTSTALAFTAHLLAKHPDVQERLHREVVDAFPPGVALDGSEANYDTLKRMAYLDCVFHEALRMYPPVIKFTARTSAEETTVGGWLRLPKGVIVDIPTYSLHHDEKIWPEPEKFDPDRLDAEGWAEAEKRFEWLPFGAGPRNCVGTRFARMEYTLTLASVVRRFRLRLPEGEETKELRIGQQNVLLRPVDGVRVTLQER